jgi:hypothetical protein
MVGVEFGGKDSSNRLKAEKGVAMVGDMKHQQYNSNTTAIHQQYNSSATSDVQKPVITSTAPAG